MRLAALVWLLAAAVGCVSVSGPDAETGTGVTLSVLQERAIQRHLSGEVTARLSGYADRGGRASQWAQLPDLARFVRNAGPERGAEVCREMLWECMLACNVQFSSDPEELVREFCAGQLRCRTEMLLAEKQYLYPIVWKTPQEQQRSGEVERETEQLFGGISALEAGKIVLSSPQKAVFSPVAVSEDPAESLKIAGVFCLMPDEIRRQLPSGSEFDLPGVLREIQVTAARYAIEISGKQLNEAVNRYRNDPSPVNLLRCRKWSALHALDVSRMPSAGGSERARQFVNSMLLLQEGF